MPNGDHGTNGLSSEARTTVADDKLPRSVKHKVFVLPPGEDDWKNGLAAEIIEGWGGGKVGHEAAAIAFAEDGLNCDAIGDHGHSFGIFQINDVHRDKWEAHGWTEEDMLDCDKNQVIAKEIYADQKWRPWSTFKNEKYLEFLQ